MAGISALASVWLRESHARATARGGLVALIVGIVVALAALHFGSTVFWWVPRSPDWASDRRSQERSAR